MYIRAARAKVEVIIHIIIWISFIVELLLLFQTPDGATGIYSISKIGFAICSYTLKS